MIPSFRLSSNSLQYTRRMVCPNTLEILDLPDAGQLQLSLLGDDGGRLSAPPVNFPFPVTEAEQQEIAWLLDGYGSNPFGDSRSRAEAVETGLRDLGRLLLETVFRSSPEALEIWSKFSAEDAETFRISIVSPRPAFLALPWELLNSPEVGYVANRAEALTRQSTTAAGLPSFSTAALPDTQFNVLMLCPPGDQGIAAETLQALDSLDVEVSLECVVETATDALEARLADREGHYHVLHLDGMATASGRRRVKRFIRKDRASGCKSRHSGCAALGRWPRRCSRCRCGFAKWRRARGCGAARALEGSRQKAVCRRILWRHRQRTGRRSRRCQGARGPDAAPPPPVCCGAAGLMGLGSPCGLPVSQLRAGCDKAGGTGTRHSRNDVRDS